MVKNSSVYWWLSRPVHFHSRAALSKAIVIGFSVKSACPLKFGFILAAGGVRIIGIHKAAAAQMPEDGVYLQSML